jgi:hypothetical protein
MFKFIQDVKTFLYYKSVVKKHEEELSNKFKLRIDTLGRLYTVFSISPADYKAYGDALVESEMKKYIASVDKFLIKLKLAELYGLASQEKITDNNYKIVIRFKPLNMVFWANLLVISTIVIITSVIIGMGLGFFLLLS